MLDWSSVKHRFLVLLLGSIFSTFALCEDSERDSYRIYLDADLTNNKTSGESIALGIKSALSEINGMIGDITLELVLKDHHGSSSRSRYNLEQISEDPNTIAVFGGMHSPPLIKARDFINQEQLLTLIPWAAATPITRPKEGENWIFRLSVDDSKAGEVLVRHAVDEAKFTKPHLLLENTGWGKANEKTMTAALSQRGIKPSGISFFKWGIGLNQARSMLEKALTAGADVIILVANAPEGITFANAMLSSDAERRRPIRSHWGITGGNFFNTLGREKVAELDLKFIQTRFSFLSSKLHEQAKTALISAATVKGVTSLSGEDIDAPTGFIHAYDLTKLFIAAAKQAGLSGDTKADKLAIKKSLEELQAPIEGLIKTYQQPFEAYSSDQPDAHEALQINDFVLGQFNADGNIILAQPITSGEAK